MVKNDGCPKRKKGCFICEGKARVSAGEERMLVEEVGLKVSEGR